MTYQSVTINITYHHITKNNPGAIQVISEIFKTGMENDEIFDFMQTCERSKLVGSKLWAAYKYSELDIRKLYLMIKDRDEGLVIYVNNAVNSGGCGGDLVSYI